MGSHAWNGSGAERALGRRLRERARARSARPERAAAGRRRRSRPPAPTRPSSARRVRKQRAQPTGRLGITGFFGRRTSAAQADAPEVELVGAPGRQRAKKQKVAEQKLVRGKMLTIYPGNSAVDYGEPFVTHGPGGCGRHLHGCTLAYST